MTDEASQKSVTSDGYCRDKVQVQSDQVIVILSSKNLLLLILRNIMQPLEMMSGFILSMRQCIAEKDFVTASLQKGADAAMRDACTWKLD